MKKESKILRNNFSPSSSYCKGKSGEKHFFESNIDNDDDDSKATILPLLPKHRSIGKTPKPKNLTPSECKSIIQSLHQKQKKMRSKVTWPSNDNISEMGSKKSTLSGPTTGKEKFRKVRKRRTQKICDLKHLHKISKTIYRSRIDMLNSRDVYIPYTWIDDDYRANKFSEKFAADFQDDDENKSLIGESIQYFSTFSTSSNAFESLEVISRKKSETDSLLEKLTLDSIQEEFDQLFANDIFDGKRILDDN